MLISFIGGLVAIDFFQTKAEPSLSPEILVGLAVLVVVVLSRSFDKLAVGKLLTLERQVKTESSKRHQAEARSDELVRNFVNLSANLSLANSNSLNVNVSQGGKAVTSASEEEIEEAVSIEAEAESDATDGLKRVKRTAAMRMGMDHIAIDKFAISRSLNVDAIKREVRFSKRFQSLDPIMERPVLFDGYIQRGDTELFLEAIAPRTHVFPFLDALYIRLAKLYFYRQVRKSDARLVLVIYEMPEELNPKFTTSNGNTPSSAAKSDNLREFRRRFQAAIDSGLLELVSVEIEDVDAVDAEARGNAVKSERRHNSDL